MPSSYHERQRVFWSPLQIKFPPREDKGAGVSRVSLSSDLELRQTPSAWNVDFYISMVEIWPFSSCLTPKISDGFTSQPTQYYTFFRSQPCIQCIWFCCREMRFFEFCWKLFPLNKLFLGTWRSHGWNF